ncbi:hypothetical protein HPB47_013582 [Ixodes persulcatus]|uniref:Uncharacterized protein n=1 Tax=Ixodes persulcatus TaxID=34615 RepID=A0AC60R2A6_IXOPE|nr:hypothetical protein HPB47_013582 [Ixodes persulcatus]
MYHARLDSLEAELRALLLGVELALCDTATGGLTATEILLHSDSAEALSACHSSAFPRSPTVSPESTELILGPTVKIKDVWVPGHAGIQSHEAAHRLARASLSYPSAGTPLLRLLDDSTSGSDKNTDTSPPLHTRTEARRRLYTRLPKCAVPIPWGYLRAAEVRLPGITTGCAWTSDGLTHIGLRSPEHAGSPLATQHHLLWECSARRQEREAALAKLSPASRPKTLEAWTAPTGPNEARKLVFD